MVEVYSELIDLADKNQMIMMVTSFLDNHPNRTITIYTDISLPPISRVIYRSRDELNPHNKTTCYASPYLIFRGSIDGFLKAGNKFRGVSYGHHDSEDRDDLVVINANISSGTNNSRGSELFNMGPPSVYNASSLKYITNRIKSVRVINTRRSQPWVEQRDSYITMSFDWVAYIECARKCETFLDEDFIHMITAGAVKHPFNTVYMETLSAIDAIRNELNLK